MNHQKLHYLDKAIRHHPNGALVLSFIIEQMVAENDDLSPLKFLVPFLFSIGLVAYPFIVQTTDIPGSYPRWLQSCVHVICFLGSVIPYSAFDSKTFRAILTIATLALNYIVTLCFHASEDEVLPITTRRK